MTGSVSAPPLVQCRRVCCGYDGVPVVLDADLVIDKGEVVALVGANGSGKTTLVKAWLGLSELTDGELQVLGHSPRSAAGRSRIGYVPQHGLARGVVPTTVREVVSAGRLRRRRLARPLGRADRSAVEDALGQVGLLGRADERMSTLSGGQQRRVLIARALAGDPELVLLDEPLAGVDRESQDQLAATMQNLVAAGRTLVLVLHELGPLADLVTRIVRLRDGRIVYDGPVTAALLGELHEDELGSHDHHHPPDGDRARRADLGLTG